MSPAPICCPTSDTESPAARPGKYAHPVAETTGAQLNGTFESLGDFAQVYVTGPDDVRDHAIVVVYDIFGFWETTMRGSDLLTTHLESVSPARVFMPDFFRGKPFPKAEDGNKELLKQFFEGTAKLSERLPEAIKFAKFLKQDMDFKRVSILGYCWGGKMSLMALSTALEEPTPFCCGAIVHPAMIASEDGDNLAAPLGFYPGHDEPKDVVERIEEASQTTFGSKSDCHLYDTVHHGWAAARADLKDPENLKQYEDVYKRLATFFSGA